MKKKKKLEKNIVLIGFMGSGKSMTACALAEILKIKRFSSDEMIEKKEKCTIAELIAKKDWSYFRKIEHSIIKKLSLKKGVIIDCGGGVVLNPKNIAFLKKNGLIFYLKTDPKIIYNRLKNDLTRPLISGPNPLARIKAILKERLPLYNQADFIIDSSSPSISVPVAQILKKI